MSKSGMGRRGKKGVVGVFSVVGYSGTAKARPRMGRLLALNTVKAAGPVRSSLSGALLLAVVLEKGLAILSLLRTLALTLWQWQYLDHGAIVPGGGTGTIGPGVKGRPGRGVKGARVMTGLAVGVWVGVIAAAV
jgi:hypothetical protein